MNDYDIFHKFQEGDESAFNELYERYWKILFMSAYNILKDKELCEEIIQDVFLTIWNKKDSISITVSLKSYLFKFRHRVFTELRKNSRTFRTELYEFLGDRFEKTTPESKMIQKEMLAQVNTIIDKLPPKCKEVFRLSREECLSHSEISKQLNISKKTIENHITKALRILKKEYGDIITMLF